MVEDAREKTERIIHELQELGRHDAAEHLELALSEKIEDALLLAIREACQTVLTAIEAIDPNTEMLLEELRLEIDKRLTRHPPGPPPAKS